MNRNANEPASSGKARGRSAPNLDAQAVLSAMHQPLIVLDSQLIVQGANRAFYNTFSIEPDATEGVAIYEIGDGQWDIPQLRELLVDILPNSGIVDDFKVEHRFETIGRRIMNMNARQIPKDDPELILLAIDDLTEQENLRWELEGQKELALKTIDAVPVPFLVLGEDLRVQKANGTFYDTFQVDRHETEGRLVYELGNNQWDIPKLRELLEDVLPDNNSFDNFEVEHEFEDIGHRIMMLNARRIDHQQLILLAIDLTAQRAREREESDDADNRSFILNLFDRLREEKEPDVLIDVTCEALGLRLDADLVFYADIDERDEYRIRPHLWSREATPKLTGHRRVGDFGHPVLTHMKEGKTLVIENVHEDPRIETPDARASFDEVSVASLVHVPLVEGGELRSVLGVQFARPRQWPPGDVTLTKELAERLWDAVARCRAEAELRTSHEKFRVLVESDAQATWETAPDGRSTHSTASWRAYTGQTEEEELGNGWINAIHPDDRGAFASRWPQHLQAELPFSEEYRLRHGEGWRWSKLRAAPVRDSLGRIVRWVGMNHDITDRKEAEKRIEHMALYDALTGLPNRTLLQDRFREAVARTKREGGDLWLCMLDVDRFKEVNDTVGHAGGDTLLRCVADRVSHALRSSDTFARLSGDEFVAVLPNVENVAEMESLAERVRSAISQPVILDGKVFTLSVSMGVVIYPQDGDELESLLRCADIALYRAKAGGRDTIRFFEPEMEAEAQRLRRTEAELKRALERGELTLFYQPQLDLTDGRIRSVEALVRWQHGDRGLLSPDEFIPVAESTGLIHPLGRWVLEEACRQVREWRACGLDLQISINVSAAEAKLDGVLEAIDHAFSEFSLEGNDVAFEMTETLLVDPANVPIAKLLAGLQARGVSVALDDFGTGYSSLSYLKDLPIDTIKIDRSFVAGAQTRDGRILLETMIELGQKLGKRIIAEGVETDEQLAWLRGTGCDAAQGFLIARPMPPDDIPKWLLGAGAH